MFEFPTLNGGERSMLACLRRLQTQFRFTAIAPSEGSLAQQICDLEIPLIAFQKQDGLDNLYQIVNACHPDLLHANSLSMSRLTGQLATSISMPTTGHLRDIMRLNKKVVTDLNTNDRLIAVSKATKFFHIQQGLNEARCAVIYNGVDTNQFRSSALTAARRQCLPFIGDDEFVVLCVGQICLRKRQRDLAKLVSRLSDRVHLVIAGERHSTKFESIQYEQDVMDQFDKHGRSEFLHCLGYRTDIPELMNAANVLVHLAHQEPFGRTLLEAAASQLPIIATDVGGTSEMLQHEQHALLVPPESLAAASAALQSVRSNPSAAESRSQRARRRICERFSAVSAAKNLSQFWVAAMREFSQRDR